MILTCFVLSMSVSIDALGIGITYGLKNTKITGLAKIILFTISILITNISIFFGNKISDIFSDNVTIFIGSFLLVSMGFFVIYQALKNRESDLVRKPIIHDEPKIYKFFIEFLGITIQIIRNPISSDLDGSKKIDWKEATYLGIALSIDSICVGICSSIIGYGSFIFPIFVASFQLLFLSIGRLMGIRLSLISNVPENIWNVFSGVLLIIIGVSKIFV